MGLLDFFRRSKAQAPLYRPPNPPPALPGPSPETRREPSVPDGAKPPEGHYSDLPVVSIGPWDVNRIQGALNAHQLGNFSQSAMLTEAMVGDDRVQTALNGRTKGVTMRHLHTMPVAKDKDWQARKAVQRIWTKVFSDELLDQFMMWTVFMSFVLCEVQWTPEEDEELGTIWVPYLKVWHPIYVWYDVAARSYVAITQEGNVYIDEDDPHWFLFTPYGRYRGWIRGAVRSCAPPWLIRQFSRRDWARYCEVHGLPIRLVDSPAQSSAIDKARMFGAVRNMGAQTTILLPQQAGQDGQKWDVRLLEAKDEAWDCFPGLIDNCDMAIQLAIRGTNLTSQIQGGSYAAAQVHSDEDTSYADADSRKLCAAAERLMRLFCAYNFGDAELCPGLRLEAPDKQDALALSQTQLNVMSMAKLARENGVTLNYKLLCERFDIPMVSQSEDDVAPDDAADPLPDEDAPEGGDDVPETDVRKELAQLLLATAAE